MGSLASNGLKGRIGLEWSQHKTQEGIIIKNNFSQQQFHIFSIPNLQINNIKLYFSRQFSSLPKTPKIICLQKKEQHLIILAQKGDKFISQWLNQIHCQLSILLKLKDVLSAANALKNKFGPFLITQKMIKISNNDNLLFWYNQKYQSNLIQLPLTKQQKLNQNQLIMVQNIIQIFRKSINKNFNINLLAPLSKSFADFKAKVKSRIQQIQLPFNSKTTSEQSIKVSIKQNRSLTPKNGRQQKLIQTQKTLDFSSSSQNSIHNKRKSDHQPTISLTDQNFRKTSQFPKQKRQIKFLLEETHYQQQKSLMNKFKKKSRPLSSLEQQSSQNYSSSNVSSRQIRNQSLTDNYQSKSFKNLSSNSNFLNNKSKKQTKYSIFNRKNDSFSKSNKIENVQLEKEGQKKQQIMYKASDQSSYRGCDSFSSKKNFSLKSTARTLKMTRQFEENIRKLIEPNHQTIRQQSDETHKNSNNYSEQSIKEQTKQEMVASVSLSQDFNNLFSMGDSIASGLEDSMREKQFQRVLFGGHL